MYIITNTLLKVYYCYLKVYYNLLDARQQAPYLWHRDHP